MLEEESQSGVTTGCKIASKISAAIQTVFVYNKIL